MDYRIPHPDFQKKVLSLRTKSFWSGMRLLVDGEPLKAGGFKGLRVTDDNGRERRIRFRGGHPFDPLPPIEIDGDLFHVAPRLNFLEIIWCVLPIGLVGIGGAVGGALGVFATYANFRVLRSEFSRPIRYLMSLGVGVGAVGVWFVVAILVQLLIQK